jgi:hypothetical protein
VAAGAEPGQAWYCLRCRRAPQSVLWLVAERRPIHAARLASRAEGMASCCGGEVVPREQADRPFRRPGDLALCMPSWGSLAVHVVRLGHRVDAAHGTWTGTALCGRTYRARFWFPLPHEVPVGDRCRRCTEGLARIRETLG